MSIYGRGRECTCYSESIVYAHMTYHALICEYTYGCILFGIIRRFVRELHRGSVTPMELTYM